MGRVGEFAVWWWAQMVSLMPDVLRTAPPGEADALVVEPSEVEGLLSCRLLLRRRRREVMLAEVPMDEAGIATARRFIRRSSGAPLELRLPASQWMERSLVLPLAAENSLREVLSHELDRITPFEADELYWGWRLKSRDRARDRLGLCLMLVPRDTVTSTTDWLRGLGLTLATLSTAGTAGDGKAFAVEEGAVSNLSGGRRLASMLGIACATLAVMALVLPVLRQARAIDRVEAQLTRLQPALEQVSALRQRLDAGRDSAAQAEGAHPLRAIAALTEALPDGTSLNSLTMRQRVLTLTGQSDAAAELIARLSTSAAIRAPSFAAPVTRGGNTASELFTIRAELAP